MKLNVGNLVEGETDFNFEPAVVWSVSDAMFTAGFLGENGRPTPVSVKIPLLPNVNPQDVAGRKVMVLTDGQICYGSRLLDGTVVSDSVDRHYNPLFRNFDTGRLREELYFS